AVVKGGRPPVSSTTLPVAQAVPLVRRALKILADREVSPQTGLLKSTLLQLDSTFSERNYGASSFLDFAEKLAQLGFIQRSHAGRSVMVGRTPGFDEGEGGQPPRPAETPVERVIAPADAGGSTSAPIAEAQSEQRPEAVVAPLGDTAEGLRIACDLLK